MPDYIIEPETLLSLTILGMTEAIERASTPVEQREARYIFSETVAELFVERELDPAQIVSGLGELLGSVLTSAGYLLAMDKERSLEILQTVALPSKGETND